MLTDTEFRIAMKLIDGLPHSKEELQRCLSDDLAAPSSLYFHISNLRRKFDRAISCSRGAYTFHFESDFERQFYAALLDGMRSKGL